jgi:hypothetical protein
MSQRNDIHGNAMFSEDYVTWSDFASAFKTPLQGTTLVPAADSALSPPLRLKAVTAK